MTPSNALTVPQSNPTWSVATRCWIALGLVAGTVLYLVPSALHGNPPIESAGSAEAVLRYVAERPSWRLVHLVNILAVLVWLVAFAALGARLTGGAREIARAAQVVLTATSAVFAVYFSLHAMALSTAARWLITGEVERTQILSQTEAVLLVLGATAFTAQAMIGLSVLLYGLTIVKADGFPAWLGWAGVVAGLGWAIGAVIVEMAVVVPFTVLTWLWMLVLAAIMLRSPGRSRR